MAKTYYTFRIRLANHELVRVEKWDERHQSKGEPSRPFRYKEKLEQINTLLQPVLTNELNNSQQVRKLGEALFEAIFDDVLRQELINFYQEAVGDKKQILRIEIDVDEQTMPEVAALPWEFMCFPASANLPDRWLGTDPNIVFSRRRALWHSADPIQLENSERLRIALAISAPKGLGTVKYEEVQEILSSLAKNQPELIELLPIVNLATPTAIDRLLEHKPHIFHFIGHGQMQNQVGEDVGQIALPNKVFNTALWHDAGSFSELFNRWSPRVVLLQACESGMLSTSKAFAGTASKIVQMNIPVVVAMQYEVSNITASEFFEEFYERLAKGEPVDIAAQNGRRTIGMNTQYRKRDFATPVIFMRVQDGYLFKREQGSNTRKTLEEFPTKSQFTRQPVQNKDSNLDALVQEVRSRLHDEIQGLHGTMPLLGVDRPVSLGDLFVDVNILEKLSSSCRSELDDLWQDFSNNPSYRSFDRIGLGREQERKSGLEVVEKNKNLMVVGKPGSGKTTYLQRVVTECNAGKLQAHLIPFLIRLRAFVKEGREVAYALKPYLEKRWELSNAEILLKQGRALVLLDGLDEVTGEDGKKIAEAIKWFADHYPQVQVIVTCRTQSFTGEMNWKSLNFQFVEVADFKEPQVRSFSEHWFKTVMRDESAGLARAGKFLEQLFLESNKPIQELAITPILLSLTCLVYDHNGKFYSKRSKLYEEGLELLLERWDKSREIERDEIYRDLSVERKLDLLSYLAVKKFEQTQYVLFEQTEIEIYIAEFLEIQQRDSRTVLRAMESQHGLLIERAQKVWSFSHLTFQEYLVAKYVVNNRATPEEVFQQLEVYITKSQGREVFLLTLELLDNADNFLQAMKCKIDSLLAKDSQLQQFLNWVNEKSQSVSHHYKTVAIRAFYYAIAYDSPGSFFKINRDQMTSNSVFDLDLALVTALFFAEALTSNQNIINAFRGNFDKTRSLAFKLGFTPGFHVGATNRDDYENLLAKDMSDSLNRACIHAANFKPQLEKPLKELLQDLDKFDIVPDLLNFLETESKIDARREWWRDEGKAWTDRLRELIVKHQNVGHNWGFNPEQKELLECYCDANKLLIDCLNSSCVVSNEVRQAIENTLLLPICEIEKRKCEKTD